MLYRQGDVLIEQVTEIKTGTPVAAKNGRIILAEGEAIAWTFEKQPKEYAALRTQT